MKDIIAGLTELRDTGKIPDGLDLDLVIKIVSQYCRKGAPDIPSPQAVPSPLGKGRKAIDVLFDRFWAVYPRKVAKADAKKAFMKISPDEALLLKMIKALERDKHSKQWTKDDGQFIPYASTWLRGLRWEDEGETVPERQGSFDADEFFEAALKRTQRMMAECQNL